MSLTSSDVHRNSASREHVVFSKSRITERVSASSQAVCIPPQSVSRPSALAFFFSKKPQYGKLEVFHCAIIVIVIRIRIVIRIVIRIRIRILLLILLIVYCFTPGRGLQSSALFNYPAT